MRPRKILRIARWEVTKNAGGIDRRTLAVAGLALALLVVVAPLVVAGGVGLDDGLYSVAVDEGSPYYDVVDDDDTFRIVGDSDEYGTAELRDGEVDLLIDGFHIVAADSAKGEAAYEQLRSSTERYNIDRLRFEANQTAAFPVLVTLLFEQQTVTPTFDDPEVIGQADPDEIPADPPDDDPPDEDPPDEEPPDEDPPDEEPPDEDPSDEDPPDDGPTDDDPTDEGLPDDELPDETDEDDEDDGADGPLGELLAPLSDGGVSGSPSELSPPFPFQSLILAFLFVIPLNFLIQAYGSTILSERINRRGELLLVSPVSRLDIIAGKTLPYFAGAMLVEALLVVGLIYLIQGHLGGLVSIVALMPLVLLFLGATFLGAMFARSFKELTFVTVTITVVLTTYAFVPAIFTDTTPVALISPLTLVVMDLQNEAITLSQVVFSTTPPTLVALVMFGLGAGLYREEDMFDQRPMSGRVLDSLAGPITRRWHVGAMTMVLVPFVFVAQLLAVALLFMLGDVFVAIVLMFIVVAITEEAAKSLHIYAAFEHGRFEATAKMALVLGLASGVGFFLAEKIALLAQLAGLEGIDLAAVGLMGGFLADPTNLALLLPPLFLHVVTAAIAAFGASRGRQKYIAAVALAMVIHFAYNMTVVSLLAL